VARRRDSEHGVTAAAEILVFLIWQLPHWLLFGCKNSQKRLGDLLAKGSLAMLPALTGGCTHRATWAASRCCAKFGETDP
jgi:hypothetical protein